MSDVDSITPGWKFTYSLSNSIDCSKDIHDMEDVEFVTKVDNGQNRITGFKITVHLQKQIDANPRANHMALRLVSLLVASSGTHSTHHLDEREDIMSGKREDVKLLKFRYGFHDCPAVNMDPEVFRDLLNSNTVLAKKIHFIASALRAFEIRDHSSVIKYLVLACNDKPTGDWAKFVHLRHVLSHNDGRLNKNTREGLNTMFGSDYFILTNRRFDLDSASNLRHLEYHAGEFLTHMYDSLKEELCQMKERPSEG